MTKQSQRRTLRYEKDKSGCMRGIINMFDFRHGHTTQKLISGKLAVGSIHSKNKFEGLSNLDEVTEGDLDNGESKRVTVKTYANKPSVKKLIEEEMFIDQNPVKDIDNAKLESKKRSKRSRDNIISDTDTGDLNLDASLKSESSHSQHSRQQSKDNIYLDKVIEEFFNLKDVSSVTHGNDGEIDVQSKQKHTISKNIARDAIDEFVNQMILNSKDLAEARKFLCSDELREALELISSEKEFSLPVRQDPNSLLLKYVQDFVSSQRKTDKDCSSVNGSNFSEQELGNLEQTKEIVNHKKYNFFRRKVKSPSKSSTNENGNTDFSNRIVILKPGSMDLKNSATENNIASPLLSHDAVHTNGPYAIGSSHFFLTEIKKKLKHAMGRGKHGNSKDISRKHPAESQNKGPSGKAIGKDSVGMRSPNKDHFFIEKIARPTNNVMKGDKTGTLKDSELNTNTEQENGSYPKPKLSNLYIEAKKHLSEIVSNGDENIELSSRKYPSTLGRILSLPEYNFSPLGSPVRDLEHNFVTAETRYSARNKNWEDNENNLSPEQATRVDHLERETDNQEKQSCICGKSSNDKVQEIESDSNFSDDHNQIVKEENSCLVRDEIVTEGDLESAREIDILESFSEPVGLSTGNENNNISEIPDSANCSECMKQDVIEENQPSSPLSLPSHSSITNKIEELESGSDICLRPCPVSVLDTFLEDDVSLGFSIFKPVEVRVRLQLEEQDSSPVNRLHGRKHYLEDNELIYDYIKKVLQASGLTRDQLIMKCLSSDKILEPSSFNQVELLSNRLCQDQKLLYDCTNEVLVEVCWHYFGVSPFISFVNPSTRLTPNMQKVIIKVWEGVCWYFLPFPPPRTLDKIVRKDMDKNGSWMDLRFEAEKVGFEMSEAILAELMEDVILSWEDNKVITNV
ncbi:hypothetical protein TanjilG_21912 [Lupinus angustifolius]|uniref:DUF4378 domain-containing protein n=1 Tax=Lupinus angustifolius TaxID=3871 RepID=A0A1J7GMT6_LUPAN|nr:PREDICTED: uncharacterized protein LOC109341267 [Lupinus angustifolius]XP_019434670.1 PREDICTED: uncharacterized protein LOC109341267 [Lupinus angustifolius]XP_019434671.1 PREDICTED: uncharacterized protein LOC109341267 [Lupinus angustifolius]OIV89418.1 hypothetical protein TanjilG_21912 [Lupinus angustifolius]